MPRRKTVKLNVPVVAEKIKAEFRHNVLFCIKMGRENHPTWVSDWGRTPPKNLPSPEEAARMCELLHTTPEDILTDAEDVTLVRGLLEQAEKNNAPAPITEGERIDPTTARIIEIVRQLDPKVRESYLQQLESLLALQDAAQKRDSQG